MASVLSFLALVGALAILAALSRCVRNCGDRYLTRTRARRLTQGRRMYSAGQWWEGEK